MAAVPPIVMTAEAEKLAMAVRELGVATLTAAVVQRASRPMSLKEIFELRHDVWWAMYPNPQLGSYKEWEKTKAERLEKVR